MDEGENDEVEAHADPAALRRRGKERSEKITISTRFADRLRSRREELGFTREEIAEKCGLSLSTIGRLERAVGAAYAVSVAAYAEALGLDANEELARAREWAEQYNGQFRREIERLTPKVPDALLGAFVTMFRHAAGEALDEGEAKRIEVFGHDGPHGPGGVDAEKEDEETGDDA